MRGIASLVCLSISFAVASLDAQTAPTADVADGAARLARQDWPGAIAAFRRVVAANAHDHQAWLQLAIAYQGADRLDLAADAAEHAVEAGAPGFAPHLRLARIAALRGRRDEAFAHIEHALDRGLRIPLYLTASADLASLRGDTRFEPLVARVTARRYPCRTDTLAHQFDFWLGSWEVYVGGQRAGTNEITSDLEQCLVVERWTDVNGGRGSSINFVDSNSRKWRQVWVADGGNVVDYTGGFRDGAMRFEAVTIQPNGARTLQKLTFFPIARDTVRQLFESSSDGGASWTSGFDGLYVRAR
jgi:tetratricopeptide (TPR) repeat protein